MCPAVKLKLIGANENDLLKGKQDIIALAERFCTQRKMTGKQDMLDWSQQTLYRYYEYCLKLDVLPVLDLANATMELNGPREVVRQSVGGVFRSHCTSFLRDSRG